VFGNFSVAKKKFLIVISEASLMGQILKCNIYRVDAIRFEPLQLAKLMPRDISQMAMLEKIIKEKAMYFSYDYNLTQSSQHIINGILGEREEWKV
jgi:hypothetical protein